MSEANGLYARITAGKPSILMVDDDANILETAKDILEEANFEISTASTGAAAFRLLEQNDFNVVVVDFNLPDSTGLEIARKVRELSEHTLVILMTGHASLEMAVKAIQAAVYDYLIKPVDPAQLQRAIEKAVEKQRLTLENKQLLADLQKTNEAISRLDALKSKMLRVMSHDMKTPLSSIRGYSELLKSGVKGRLTDSQKNMVEITIQEADHLNGLISDMLDLANIDSGKLNLELRAVSFDEVLKKALARVRLVSEMKEIPVELKSSGPLPAIAADAMRMVQVVANLLRSSLKHAGRGGRVELKVVEKGGMVDVKISFAAQAFTPEQLKSIFEWKSAPGETNGSQDGLRIGLAIAREIMHAHGGEIGVESGAEGTVFWFRLPISKTTPQER